MAVPRTGILVALDTDHRRGEMVAAMPFSGQLVRPERVGDVVSPAYDALTQEQRRRYRTDHPLSYLHVTRSAPDEDDGSTIDDHTLVTRGRASLERILAAGVFAPVGEPAVVVYELEHGEHRQRGVVIEVAGSEFRARAKPHEATQPDRTALLAEHSLIVRAASSPVACTVAAGHALDEVVSGVDVRPPAVEHRSDDGLVQRVWLLEAAATAAAIAALADQQLYIIDGHHRAAANAQLLERGFEVPLLVAVFTPSSLGLAGFHRLLRLPEDLAPAEYVRRVSRRFRVTPTDDLVPPSAGTVVIGTGSGWHHVEFDERPVAGGPLIRLGSTDPCIVERELIGAIGGRDGPVDVVYMPDEGGLDVVVDEAKRLGRVPILLAPVTIDDVIEVADGGLTMPPKSTYFTPKVRSGLFLLRYDEIFDS